MASQSALALPAPVKEIFACLTVGVILSSVIYGITFLQTYIYFRRYPEDHLALKVLVGVLLILDSASSAIDGSVLYDFFVNQSPRLEQSILFPPPLIAEIGVKLLIRFLTQCFFTRRLWLLTKSKILIGTIAFFNIGGLASGIFFTQDILTYPVILSLHESTVRISVALSNGLSTASDILLATGLCFYLNDERSERARTKNLLDRLIRYAMQCCAITAVCQSCIFINAVAIPGHFFAIPFLLIQGKLYCNTLLATLNVRRSLREAAVNPWGEQLEPGLGTCVVAMMPQNSSSGVGNTLQHSTPRAELVAPVEVDIATAKRD